VVVDKEIRGETDGSFVDALRRAFDKVAFGVKVSTASPDVMIETWYLADISSLSRSRVYLRPQET
jgi:hypothetical protein